MRRSPPVHRLGLWLAAAALGALTLFPGDAVWRAVGLARCLACGDLNALDAIHNLLLFIPVGVIMQRLAGRWPVALGSGALISLGIELLQAAIPAREASIVDVATNAAGASLGVALAAGQTYWLSPTPRAARRWSLGAALAFAGILTATGVLAQPAPMPPATLYGQWAPPRANFDPFRGRVVALQVGGIAAPHGMIPDQAGARAAWNTRPAFAIDVNTGGPIGSRPVLMARLVATDDEMFVAARQGEDFLVRFRLRATDAGLRSPVVRIPAPPGRLERAHLEAGIVGGRLRASVSDSSGVSSRSVPFDVAVGWTFLLPVEVALGTWMPFASAFWMGLLALPTGFYLAAASGARRNGAPALWPGAAGLAVAAVAAALAFIPIAVSAAPSQWTAWAGTAVGLLAGRRLWVRASRGRGGSRNAPDPPSL